MCQTVVMDRLGVNLQQDLGRRMEGVVKKNFYNKLVRPRWPYDMRPSVRAEKYMCVIVIRQVARRDAR